MEDLTGRVFTKLTVLGPRSLGRKRYWTCLCDCGLQVESILEEYLKSGATSRCSFCKNEKQFEEFLENISSREGTKIEIYSEVEPKHFKLGVRYTFNCRRHGIFSGTPSVMITKGRGCPGCGKERFVEESYKNFIEKANIIHSHFYDYRDTKLKYKSTTSKVDIICPRHGVFTMQAASHLAGHGCRSCVHSLSTEEFTEKASFVHGSKYDYSFVEYLGAHEKVKIVCKQHGVFEQSPNSHFSGAGCPFCVNERRSYDFVERYTLYPEEGSEPGCIYLMEVESEAEKFLKIGITKNLRKRMLAYKRDKNYSFKLLHKWESNILQCAVIESEVLKWKKENNFHYWPRSGFDGRSECIIIESLCQLIDYVEDQISIEI